MKHKKRIIFAVAVLLTAAGVLSGMRIYVLNKQFPDPTVIEHAMHEEIDGGSISLAVIDSILADPSYIKKIAPDYMDSTENPDGTKVSDGQIRTLLITVELNNRSDTEQEMSLVQMYAESLIWANGIDGGLYPLFNENSTDPMGVRLKPYEKKRVILPYTMYDLQFQHEDWKQIDQRDFRLTLSFYPEKHVVNLT